MGRVGGIADLDAVISIGEVVHGLELLVDDADTGFMCSDSDIFDVFCGFALLFQLRMNVLGSFDGGLRMEFGFGIS